ncbi:fdrA domain protein [Chloroflexota bacterium]
MKQSDTENLPSTKPQVINIGVKTFYDSLRAQGVKVVHVDWHPPAGGELDLTKLLDKLS